MTHADKTTFEQIARAQAADAGTIREFWNLLNHNKKWWLLPVVVVLLLLGGLLLLSSSAAAPFLYTLF
jgi:Family of unknown function (DUF5989)